MHGVGNRIHGPRQSYITDCLQNAKSLTIFEDFVAQRQGLVNWFSRILEDKNFARGQQHCEYSPAEHGQRDLNHVRRLDVLAARLSKPFNLRNNLLEDRHILSHLVHHLCIYHTHTQTQTTQ